MNEKLSTTPLPLPLNPTAESVAAWLERLPAVSSHENSQQIYEALSALAREAIDPGIELAILEKFRPAVFLHSRKLQERVIVAPSPLDKRNRKIAKLSGQLHRKMAAGYYRMTKRREFFTSFSSDQQAKVIARAIQSTGMAMLRSAQIYTAPSQTLWNDFNALFRLADKLKLDASPVHEPISQFARNTSVSQLLKRTLLFSLANPYAFSPVEMQALFFFFEKISARVILDKTPVQAGTLADFYFDLQGHQPPAHISHAQKRSSERYLFVRQLMEELHRRIEAGPQPNDPLSDLATNKLALLVRYLGSGEENPRLATVSEHIVSDYDAIVATLAVERQKTKITDPKLIGKDWDAVSTLELQPLEEERQSAHLARERLSVETSLQSSYRACATASSRIEGYCIVEIKSEDIGCGQLVMLKNDAALRIGIVRWLQDLSHIGIRRLGVEMVKGQVSLANLETKAGDITRAIRITPASDDPDSRCTVILPPGKNGARATSVCEEAGCGVFSLGPLLEANPFFFHFATVAHQTPSDDAVAAARQ